MTDDVTRFEVIDHRDCSKCDGQRVVTNGERLMVCDKCEGSGTAGRTISLHNVSVELSLQDGGRTLKVFIDD